MDANFALNNTDNLLYCSLEDGDIGDDWKKAKLILNIIIFLFCFCFIVIAVLQISQKGTGMKMRVHCKVI